MTPREAFEAALARAWLSMDHPLKPGALIERLPDETREALQGLTSDDVALYFRKEAI